MNGVDVELRRERADGSLTDVDPGIPAATQTQTVGSLDGYYEYANLSPTGGACLTIRVQLPTTPGTPTRVVTGPAQDQQIDFRIGAELDAPVPRQTEVTQRLDECLQEDGGGVTLESLDTTGVARLAIRAGLPPNEVALARNAKASEIATGINPQAGTVPAPAFFAFGKAGLGGTLPQVLRSTASERQRALQLAIDRGVLSSSDATAAQGNRSGPWLSPGSSHATRSA